MRFLRPIGQTFLLRAFFVLLLGGFVSVPQARAAMSPTEIELACNGLARMAFDLKDLVNTVAAKRNPGPFQVRCYLPKTVQLVNLEVLIDHYYRTFWTSSMIFQILVYPTSPS